MRIRSIALGIALPVLALASASGADAPPAAGPADYDVLIRGGTVYTGDAPPFVGDVAVKGDRIAYVGPRAAGQRGAIDRCQRDDRRAGVYRSAHPCG